MKKKKYKNKIQPLSTDTHNTIKTILADKRKKTFNNKISSRNN